MKYSKIHTLETAAAKAGMDVKTAKKYIEASRNNHNVQSKGRHWRTHEDAFDNVWLEIKNMLQHSPGLHAKTLMIYLIRNNPEQFNMTMLRSLQRRIKDWRIVDGPDKEVIFRQTLEPGRQSQSDCTVMNSLNITIAGKPFPHMLFHWMLPFSRWETVSVCFSESFDSLSQGYESAVWELGAVAGEHRTDNLTAATHHEGGNKRAFNERWKDLLKHYTVVPSRNNPGISHENGSVEKSNHLTKTAVDQQLMLRGSRDFASQNEYEEFLREVLRCCNHGRKERLEEEFKYLIALPERRWNAPYIVIAQVSPSSIVNIAKGVYSVPSRLIGCSVQGHVYPLTIELYYGNRKIQTMQRLPKEGGELIDYRHIVAHLQRKPGAFAHYQYREWLFPRVVFRKAYDALIAADPANGHKHYLQVLRLAAIGNEHDVSMALASLVEGDIRPTVDAVKSLLGIPISSVPVVNIIQPNLAMYDVLLAGSEVDNASIH
jgi:hypothetical protein